MRHLLSTKDLDKALAIEILDVAEDMSDVSTREVKKLPTLRGKTVVNLFFEDSTRTRVSFEAAAKRLSADVLNFSAKGSSVTKGESLKDTAQTLAAIGADAVVLRHPASGAPRTLAASGWIDAGVINAGDGTHEHPTQALLDAFTIRRRLHGTASRGRDLNGVTVTVVGDILHSRVARSNVWLLSTLGAVVTLVAPPTLMPVGVSAWPVIVAHDLDAALGGRNTRGSGSSGSGSNSADIGSAPSPDVLMMLRIQGERMTGEFFPNVREYARSWGLDDDRFHRLGRKTIVMHPGPMNRGLEISSSAADSAQSSVLEQVTNGVSVRMAALFLLLSGEKASTELPTTPAEKVEFR